MGDDFYEDDEPVEKIAQAFDRGVQGVTGPAARGRTEFLDTDWHIAEASNETHGEVRT